MGSYVPPPEEAHCKSKSPAMSGIAPEGLQSATTQFYDANPTLEHGRLEAHRIEFEVTLRTILEYLPNSSADVLDVGCGTGKS